MEPHEKISPAFSAFFAESGPNDIREAVVIYRKEAPSVPLSRTRKADMANRLRSVRSRARSQEAKFSEGVKKLSSVCSIGNQSLPVAAVDVTRKTLQDVASHPEVVAIMPNQKIRLIRPLDIRYENLNRHEAKGRLTWGLKQLEIPRLWKRTKGAGITVGVMDTGVHAEHPALKGRVKQFIVVDPAGRRIESDPPFDSGRHGTHVCGTIAGGKSPEGVSIGVAPEADLVVGGVLVGDSTLQTLLEGISWAVEQGAHILSMSLGFTHYEPKFTLVFQDLLDLYGILPVVAIGNENHGNTSSPGNAWNALSVGAIGKATAGKTTVASFSSGASLVFPGQETNSLVTKPDLVAPGMQVYSCIPPENRRDGHYKFTYMDGTSMAAPHVTGVAALLMSAKPSAPVTDIIDALKQTAWHPSATNRPDNRWGFGIVRPVEALKALN